MENEYTERTEHVPKDALCFTVGPFELGEHSENAKSAQFRMVARSGDPINHWYWGKVIHDMSGMWMHKDRLTIDYAHDEREIIGYANGFNIDDGNLNISGRLVSFSDKDRASEIIYKSKEGVPYEASIFFDEPVLTKIPDGSTEFVNGREISGPATVVSKWSLRGIAVCPYGADMNTSTELLKQETVPVIIRSSSMAKRQAKENEMNETAIEDPKPVESVEAVPITEEAAEEVKVEQEPTKQTTEVDKLCGQAFLDAFGNQGGVWFAQGKSFEEARDLYIEEIVSENSLLKQKLSALDATGEAEPIAFAADEDGGSKQGFKSKIKIASR